MAKRATLSLLWPPPKGRTLGENRGGRVNVLSLRCPSTDAPVPENKHSEIMGYGLHLTPTRIYFDNYPGLFRDMQLQLSNDLQDSFKEQGFEIRVRSWYNPEKVPNGRHTPRVQFSCKSRNCHFSFQLNGDTDSNRWYMDRGTGRFTHTHDPVVVRDGNASSKTQSKSASCGHIDAVSAWQSGLGLLTTFKIHSTAHERQQTSIFKDTTTTLSQSIDSFFRSATSSGSMMSTDGIVESMPLSSAAIVSKPRTFKAHSFCSMSIPSHSSGSSLSTSSRRSYFAAHRTCATSCYGSAPSRSITSLETFFSFVDLSIGGSRCTSTTRSIGSRGLQRESCDGTFGTNAHFGATNCWKGNLADELVSDEKPKSRELHDLGLLLLKDGAQYFGEVRDGESHGVGVSEFQNGNRYYGEWSDGKKHVQGVYGWKSGDKYSGEWKDGRCHGYGTYTWAAGDEYIGEWSEGKMHGRGIKRWAFGRAYSGHSLSTQTGFWQQDEVWKNGVQQY